MRKVIFAVCLLTIKVGSAQEPISATSGEETWDISEWNRAQAKIERTQTIIKVVGGALITTLATSPLFFKSTRENIQFKLEQIKEQRQARREEKELLKNVK